jgi:AraC-like DNA-binding protein
MRKREASGPRPKDWARYRAVGAGVELLEAEFERYVYERHFHDTYAIGVTLRGVQRFRCAARTHDSVPGDVMMIPPGEVHDGKSGSSGGYAYWMFYVPETVLWDVLREDSATRGGTPWPRTIVLKGDPTRARRLEELWQAMSSDPQSLHAQEAFVRAFAGLSPAEPPNVGSRATADRTLLRVRDYLHDHLAHRIGMPELAAIAGMSRFQLTRRFERAFGLPLHAYHVQARLHEARRRLRRGGAISSVAHELGFADQSHLHRRFKGSFGTTPGEWRDAVV